MKADTPEMLRMAEALHRVARGLRRFRELLVPGEASGGDSRFATFPPGATLRVDLPAVGLCWSTDGILWHVEESVRAVSLEHVREQESALQVMAALAGDVSHMAHEGPPAPGAPLDPHRWGLAR